MLRFSYGLIVIGCGLWIASGCDSKSTAKTNQGKSPANNEAHHHDDHADHDHDHPAHGPNDGHLIELTPNDLHAEWTHSSSNDIIKVFILDKDGKKNQPIKADQVTITPSTGSNPAPFKLTAVAPDANGETAEFMLDSDQLNLAMSLGVKVEFQVGDKKYQGEIPPHAPHDH